MRTRMIAVLAIGALVIGGAAVASAQVGGDDDAGTTVRERFHEPGALLQEALDELVAENESFTQADADAVIAKLEEKRAELDAFREERRAEAEAFRTQMEEFLADDVLTADELAQLPDWHPLSRLDPDSEYLADGRLDADELAELRLGAGRGHHRGGPGHMGPFGGPGQGGPYGGSGQMGPFGGSGPTGGFGA